jgi:hypothetical protein
MRSNVGLRRKGKLGLLQIGCTGWSPDGEVGGGGILM